MRLSDDALTTLAELEADARDAPAEWSDADYLAAEAAWAAMCEAADSRAVGPLPVDGGEEPYPW